MKIILMHFGLTQKPVIKIIIGLTRLNSKITSNVTVNVVLLSDQ